jgi:hypothetical protein
MSLCRLSALGSRIFRQHGFQLSLGGAGRLQMDQGIGGRVERPSGAANFCDHNALRHSGLNQFHDLAVGVRCGALFGCGGISLRPSLGSHPDQGGESKWKQISVQNA